MAKPLNGVGEQSRDFRSGLTYMGGATLKFGLRGNHFELLLSYIFIQSYPLELALFLHFFFDFKMLLDYLQHRKDW